MKKISVIVILAFFLVLSFSFVKAYEIGGGFGIDICVGCSNNETNQTKEQQNQGNTSYEEFSDEDNKDGEDASEKVGEEKNLHKYYNDKSEGGEEEKKISTYNKEQIKLNVFSKSKMSVQKKGILNALLIFNLILVFTLILTFLKFRKNL